MWRRKLILALILAAHLLVSPVLSVSDDSPGTVNASEILDRAGRGKPLEYDNVVVVGDLNLGDLDDKSLGTVHFNKTTFQGSVSFVGINFSGDANFRGATFGDGANFNDAVFNGGTANFREAKFSGDANFREAKFNGSTANFYDATFNGSADFYGATFNGGTANFCDATFGDGANFNDATFGDGANFKNATFSGDAINFKNATFSGYAEFSEAQFNGSADFYGAKFNGSANFNDSKFGKEAHFERVNFNGSTEFEKAKFIGEANFNDAQFNKTVVFRAARFEEDALFNGAKFGDNICLNRVKYDKLYLKWDSIEGDKLGRDDEVYLRLIKNYREELGWFDDSNECYYEYMKYRECDDDFYNCAEPIFKFVYGYGTKPEYPIYWSFFLMVFFAFIWHISGVTTYTFKVTHKSINSLIFSMMIFLSGMKISVDPPIYGKKSGNLGSFIDFAFVTERVLASILFYFFLFAVSASLLIKIT